MSLSSGDLILNGQYRIERLIGRGAFAEVYLARHLRLDVLRAVKVLRRDMDGVGSTTYAQYRDAFSQEARLTAQLDHPHVIRAYDFAENTERGELYLVMEYAPGGSLKDLLAKQGPLAVEQVVRLAQDLCDGLIAIHEQLGVVHRDIKPSNILFDELGNAKIGDLGLAQVPGGHSHRSLAGSNAPTHPGTPEYMSPEQGSTVGYLLPSSDIFSLGCVLFEALTGKLYKAPGIYGTRVRNHRPDVPKWLDAVVARSLSETPARMPVDDHNVGKRFRTVQQLCLNFTRRGTRNHTVFCNTNKRQLLWGSTVLLALLAVVTVSMVPSHISDKPVYPSQTWPVRTTEGTIPTSDMMSTPTIRPSLTVKPSAITIPTITSPPASVTPMPISYASPTAKSATLMPTITSAPATVTPSPTLEAPIAKAPPTILSAASSSTMQPSIAAASATQSLGKSVNGSAQIVKVDGDTCGRQFVFNYDIQISGYDPRSLYMSYQICDVNHTCSEFVWWASRSGYLNSYTPWPGKGVFVIGPIGSTLDWPLAGKRITDRVQIIVYSVSGITGTTLWSSGEMPLQLEWSSPKDCP